MAQHSASINWQNSGPDFLNNKYSRAHRWSFDGGAAVEASAAPEIVASPWSIAQNIDPEEAFVASIASCHMLFFLHIASQQGLLIESYSDNAIGYLEKNDSGKMAITRVALHPKPVFSDAISPDSEAISAIHKTAHDSCFIANSVTSKIEIF